MHGRAEVTPGSVWLLRPCYFHDVTFLFIESENGEYYGNKEKELICAQYPKSALPSSLASALFIFFKEDNDLENK